jgi:hypothetical protein
MLLNALAVSQLHTPWRRLTVAIYKANTQLALRGAITAFPRYEIALLSLPRSALYAYQYLASSHNYYRLRMKTPQFFEPHISAGRLATAASTSHALSACRYVDRSSIIVGLRDYNISVTLMYLITFLLSPDYLRQSQGF